MRLFTYAVISIAFSSLAFTGSAQSLWSESKSNRTDYFSARSSVTLPSQYKLMKLNATALKNIQLSVPALSDNALIAGAPFQLPLPDGSIHSTTIVETSLWDDKAVTENIGLKTYTMINPQTKAVEGNLTVWNDGITGVVFSSKGTVNIDPLNIDNSGDHIVYYMKDGGDDAIKCLVDEAPMIIENNLAGRTAAGDCRKRTYRLAVAATGEYTAWAGGTSQAVGYITITMNLVNAIYLRDVNVTFSLVSNTNILHTDAATDPYSPGSVSATMLNENQTSLDGLVGSGNYDVGIVLTRAGGGGIAQLGAVCVASGKGRGAAGDNGGIGANPTPGPQGQWFTGATAHELAHMFGAGHTFSSTNGQCGGGNFMIGSSWETGGGSTLMAYGNVCTGNSYQAIQDHYFHAGSIAQMQNYITSTATCTSPVTTANQAPSVNSIPGTSFNVPANTPFVLTMSATDANSDALSYTWEQMNPTVGTNNNNVSPQGTNVQGPLFRSYPPSNTATRYFPNIQSIVNGAPPTYEVLPTVARTMNFRGTVRDNSSLGGCTAEVDVTLNVHASSGFRVTAPGWGTNVWAQLTGTNTASIVWDVAGTNAAPINCANVDILFSTDGGLTYPTVLATATPNDGQHNIIIPGVNTSTGRIMVKGSNNVFFSISEEPVFVSHPMPVTFLSFTARKQGNTVDLDWSTATETNSDKFIIERSANGAEFTNQLGSVRAAGNSTTVQRYKFNDQSPLNTWNYYRLRQIDTDGKYAFSNTVSVYFDKGSFLSVYPNPVRDITTIEFMTEQAGKINIEVYDSKGSLMIRDTYNAMAGVNRTTVNMESFSKGIYTLKCYTQQSTLGVMKLIKE
jgi:hypothetical protein